VAKDAVIGDDLLLLSDSAVINFGADNDVTVTHDPDDGLILKSTATGDDNPFLLTLQTGETDLAANDVIGKIAFQAPDEGTGTDAILVSGAIQARAEGDHSASSNATSLDFMTGASEAATTKMSLRSDGHLKLQGTNSLVFGENNTTSSYQSIGGEVAANNLTYRTYQSHIFKNATGQTSTTDGTEVLKIDANGHVTMPKQPAFIAYDNSNNNHTFSSADTFEALGYAVEAIDKNSDFASSTFTAPVDGTYFVASHAMFNASSSGEIRHDLAIYVNSSQVLYKQGKGDNYTTAKSMNILGLLDLDANDAVRVYSRVSDTKGRIYSSQTTSTFHGYLVA